MHKTPEVQAVVEKVKGELKRMSYNAKQMVDALGNPSVDVKGVADRLKALSTELGSACTVLEGLEKLPASAPPVPPAVPPRP